MSINNQDSANNKKNEQALSGIKVLDLSRILSGPWCTQNLADLGAEVIKVERPGAGDDTRSWGPPWLPSTNRGEKQDSSYYAAANRGKRSITINIKTEEGQKLVRKLAEKCDVIVENYKVGNLKKYGLDYQSIKAINPKIIYCSITGFGQEGPLAHRPGYDFVFQGMGGLMSVTGERDDRPGGGPQKVGIAIGDIITGMYSTIAILAALNYRNTTGEGQHIDMSLLDCIVALGSNQITAYFASSQTPQRMGNEHMSLVPYGVYSTKNGHIIIAAGNNEQWQKLCKVLKRADLAENPNYAEVKDRIKNRESLNKELNKTLKDYSTSYWLRNMEKNGVPCGPINTYADVFKNEQVVHRELHLEQKRSDGSTIGSAASPMRLLKTPPSYELPPPTLGQHTEEILMKYLGLKKRDIENLLAKGAI